MKNKKLILFIAHLSGLSYAGINAAFDNYYGEDFKSFDFIINFILWLIIGGFVAKYSIKQSEKKNK